MPLFLPKGVRFRVQGLGTLNPKPQGFRVEELQTRQELQVLSPRPANIVPPGQVLPGVVDGPN